MQKLLLAHCGRNRATDRAGNRGRVRCATYRRVRGSSGIVDFTRAGNGEAIAPRKSISSCQNQRPDLRRDWSAIWIYASASASGHRQGASRSQEDLGSTSAVSPRYGEASLVAFKCFRADSGIARAMGRRIFKAVAITKTSARAFDRRTGCRHPPVDKEGLFVKYSGKYK